jgi:small subunit ribosomal protein S19
MTRSVWKGPFVDGYLLKKAEKVRASGRSEIIKMWSRRSTVLRRPWQETSGFRRAS